MTNKPVNDDMKKHLNAFDSLVGDINRYFYHNFFIYIFSETTKARRDIEKIEDLQFDVMESQDQQIKKNAAKGILKSWLDRPRDIAIKKQNKIDKEEKEQEIIEEKFTSGR